MKSKSVKRAEALERQGAHEALSPNEKLAKLVSRGCGHCKEAQRLRALLADKEGS